MDNKLAILRFETEMKKVQRDGVDKLMGYIRQSDFYTAPASTRFHLSCAGGLLRHSLNVLDALRGLLVWNPGTSVWEYQVAGHAVDAIPDESVIISALLHDICKTAFYSVSTRNVKNKQTGKWEEQPFYTVSDRMPLGHGDKSAMIIKEYMTLTQRELYSVWWHMGAMDTSTDTRTFKTAVEKYPFILALHTADMMASSFMEAESGNKPPFQPEQSIQPESDEAGYEEAVPVQAAGSGEANGG